MKACDTILILADGSSFRREAATDLIAAGAEVLFSTTIVEGIALAASVDPTLFVLDLGMEARRGIDVCRELRRWTTAPIVVVSASDAESEMVALFHAGADDVVRTPFSVPEFIARVQSQLRRARTPHRDAPLVLETDGVTIDVPRRIVRRGKTIIRLTPTESAIVQVLARHAGDPVTHRQIFDAVWGREFGNPAHYLRVYVTHLRRKIEVEPVTPRLILTELGVGYRLRYERVGARAGDVVRQRSSTPTSNTSVPTAAFNPNTLVQ